MASGLNRLLKRWRGNYYVSVLLAFVARPLHFVLARAALNIEQSVQKNGAKSAEVTGKIQLEIVTI